MLYPALPTKVHAFRYAYTFVIGIAFCASDVSAAVAVPDAELNALRKEISDMKSSYEQRIAALEQRLARAEANAKKTEIARIEPAPATVSAPSPTAASNSFNPSISLILSGLYTSQKVNSDRNSYRIDGFVPPKGEIGPPARGFSLAESELTMAANIDPWWSGQLTLSVPPGDGEAPSAEEAFIRTSALPAGLKLTAGRFLSGIGYLNGQHSHTWDFSDTPLAYQAFLGGQLKNDGVQLKWLAPTETFLEFGAEALNGRGFPATSHSRNGIAMSTIFAHAGGDIGDTASWRAGVSYLATSPKDRADDDAAPSYAFSGRSKLAIADFVWKWKPEDGRSSVKVQGEYLRRRETGTLMPTASTAENFSALQSGWYVQSIYQFLPAWRIGFRHDALGYGRIDNTAVAAGLVPGLGRYNPKRDSVMIDWSPSEFSRIRLQYANDNARRDAVDKQFWLHYIVSLGAHGAHNY